MSLARSLKRILAGLTLGTVLVATVYAADETAGEARAWLERMSQSLANRNYDVRFLHLTGGQAENMRIIHRVADGAVTERLVSLDGSGREVVRTATEVVCYLPDRRTVLVEKRTDPNSLLGTVPAYSDALQTYYALATPGKTRILGRPAQFVVVQPRDNFRYGYKLWLDQETAMPLKSQLCDHEGRVLEQTVFTELNTPASIDPVLLRSSVVTDGFRWIRQDTHVPAVNLAARDSKWIVVDPPQGFHVTVTRMQHIEGASGLVQHLVLSDGWVSVSVFIEPKNTVAPATNNANSASSKKLPELTRVGSALAYSTDAQEHRITAVGEVPANTLRAIASSLQREEVRPGAAVSVLPKH